MTAIIITICITAIVVTLIICSTLYFLNELNHNKSGNKQLKDINYKIDQIEQLVKNFTNSKKG